MAKTKRCDRCNATLCVCEECGHQWCLDHDGHGLACPACGARPRPRSVDRNKCDVPGCGGEAVQFSFDSRLGLGRRCLAHVKDEPLAESSVSGGSAEHGNG